MNIHSSLYRHVRNETANDMGNLSKCKNACGYLACSLENSHGFEIFTLFDGLTLLLLPSTPFYLMHFRCIRFILSFIFTTILPQVFHFSIRSRILFCIFVLVLFIYFFFSFVFPLKCIEPNLVLSSPCI